MGCTSSVPNTSTTNANFTDKCIQYEEEYTETSRSISLPITHMANENESKVLPSCDTLVEPLHLVKSHKSLANLVSPSPELDNGTTSQENRESEKKKDNEEEEKISKLEEVIEKVIELYETDKNKVQEKYQNLSKKEETSLNHDKQDNEEHTHEEKINDDEIMSPTQSESSRVTRWEALADIAAELPASLTIDPLTGQIYALSK
ncbi:hypothetical protein K1T71_006115 [Dendrolimus kikuchii]|uniref:Uncharacterized protein n=1 Tax=Dendrolimus kikuchii TaxID=765133 RepID=A0ACC1D376_9NEOP|nr:hypothetical protein K1T71_006115 [Dendrolimus kikuchii]